MATKKQIVAMPLMGHQTKNRVYVLQIWETNPETLLLHEEISEGHFELLKDRGHLNQIFPVDYSKFPPGALPVFEYYEIN